MGVSEQGVINISTPLAHLHLNYVNMKQRVSRLRTYLTPKKTFAVVANVICAVYLKDHNKYSRHYKYMKLISRVQFLRRILLENSEKEKSY